MTAWGKLRELNRKQIHCRAAVKPGNEDLNVDSCVDNIGAIKKNKQETFQ